jgi:hypothetical protein
MNKIRLILGIVCLVIAGALAVMNLTLTPDRIWFDIGYGNMPWVPPIVFGIAAIVLLTTAGIGRKDEMVTAPQPEPEIIEDPEKTALNKRFETAFWGLFLIMLAGWWLIPDKIAPKGLWSIAVGLLLLGLNAVRYFSKIKMSGFTTFLGILSLLGGIIESAGLADQNGALLLLILGAYLILKPWFEKQGFFGKAEE